MLKASRILIALALAGLVVCAFSDRQDEDFDHFSDDEEHVADEDKPGQAHFCKFSNGTKIPTGFRFIHTACTICECTKSGKIRCSLLQCLPAYCIDDSMPVKHEGQCCAQCKYEQTGGSCVYNNMTFPHGVVLRSVEGKLQCWCQNGQIECRSYLGTLLEGLGLMAQGTIVYIVVMLLAAFFIIGLLACCACTLFIYSHYQRHQDEYEQAYDQYVNEAGWQPVEEVEQTEVDAEFLDKQAEAEKGQTNDGSVPSDAAPAYSPREKTSSEDKN